MNNIEIQVQTNQRGVILCSASSTARVYAYMCSAIASLSIRPPATPRALLDRSTSLRVELLRNTPLNASAVYITKHSTLDIACCQHNTVKVQAAAMQRWSFHATRLPRALLQPTRHEWFRDYDQSFEMLCRTFMNLMTVLSRVLHTVDMQHSFFDAPGSQLHLHSG